MKIEEALIALDKLIESPELFCDFNPPADMALVKSFETAFGVTLPSSYKTFLKNHNGGYIAGIRIKDKNSPSERESVRWNSNVFLSIEEIIEKYKYWADIGWKTWSDFKASYPYIPFFSSSVQEYLVFINPLKREKESAVYDAFHEDPVSCWDIVSHDFTSFLEEYILKKGKPDMIGRINGNAEELTRELNKEENLKKSDEEKVAEAEAYLSFYPGYALSYNKLGDALENIGDYKAAFENYSKSIELDPECGFYYYCRGKLLMNLGRYREALPDLDTAAILKPDDTFYLNKRAEVFIKLGKWELALEDCNKAISIDPEYIFSYFNRLEIYLHMNEYDKAEADDRIIDELMEEDQQ